MVKKRPVVTYGDESAYTSLTQDLTHSLRDPSFGLRVRNRTPPGTLFAAVVVAAVAVIAVVAVVVGVAVVVVVVVAVVAAVAAAAAAFFCRRCCHCYAKLTQNLTNSLRGQGFSSRAYKSTLSTLGGGLS